MIVDPNTGQPLEISQPWEDRGSVSFFGRSIGANQNPHPLVTGVLNAAALMPNATEATLANAFRGSRTIRYSGFREGNVEKGKRFKNQFINHVDPRSWSKFADTSAVYSNDEAKTGFYSPFNLLAKEGNRGLNWGANSSWGKKNIVPKMRNAGMIDDSFQVGAKNEGYFFSGGALSRLSAGRKILRLDNASRSESTLSSAWSRGRAAKGFTNQSSNAMNFIQKADPEFYKSIQGTFGDAAMTSRDMSDAIRASGKGTITNYAQGYIRGASSGAVEGDMAEVLGSAGKDTFLKGAAKGVEHMALKGVEDRTFTQTAKYGLARGATALEFGADFIPVVGEVLAAYQLAKVGLSVGKMITKSGIGLATDAMKSITGDINKPVMGMGYVDNTVASTSRARGVQAIANSRLNARSVLGSEGAMMHAHFG